MPFSSKIIKVLLVDDHKLIRESLVCILKKETAFKIVGEASNGEEALKLWEKLQPDIVLMDVKLPKLNGLEATVRLRKIDPNIKIVVFTACEDILTPMYMFNSGVYGYVTKSSDTEEVCKAILAAHSGQHYVSRDIANKLVLSDVNIRSKGILERLSKREWEVCDRITRGQTVKKIAEDLGLNTKTVNSYRYRLFDKLGVSGDVGLTRLILKYHWLEKSLQSSTKKTDDSLASS